MESYGNAAMVLVGFDTEAVENHPRFHEDSEALLVVKLPSDPPNLLVVTLKDGREFLKTWLRRLLGPFPGDGKTDKRPLWWPVEWKSPQTSGTTKNDVAKIIAALYLQFANRVLELPLDFR